jgi:hypothetical protein
MMILTLAMKSSTISALMICDFGITKDGTMAPYPYSRMTVTVHRR